MKNTTFGLEFAVVRFQTKILLTSFANFQNLVFDIVGVIAELSSTFEGWFTIHFNGNYVEKKKRCETFFSNKWFKNYDMNIRALTVLWDTLYLELT